MERLDKFLSNQTDFTRSEIKKLIAKKKVTLNGVTIKDGSTKIDPETDKVTLDGREIAFKDKVYIVMNKPEGYVCATEDKREKTVLELLPQELRRKDLFPAGRLDKDTLGMVLITNDGELSHRILSPKRHIPKYYLVELRDNFCENYAKLFKEGLEIDGGERCLPANVRGCENAPKTAFLELYEGKFHQVKRMFAAVENRVEKLCRIQMGGLPMPQNMRFGGYMELLHKDVENLLETPPFEEVYCKLSPFFSSYWINKL